MAKVIVEIELGNDAMQTGYDIATALQQVSFIIEETRIEVGLKTSIFDGNGNNVGALRIVDNINYPTMGEACGIVDLSLSSEEIAERYGL